jgi:hypothetical protein
VFDPSDKFSKVTRAAGFGNAVNDYAGDLFLGQKLAVAAGENVDVNRPTMQDFRWIGNGLAVVHMRKTFVVYNRPLAVGVAIKDISKTFMYDFHYGWVRCKMLGTGATIAAADSTARHTSWARWLYPTKRTRFLVKMAW